MKKITNESAVGRWARVQAIGRSIVGRSARTVAAVGIAAGYALPALAQKPARLPNEGAGALPWLVAGGIVVIICLSAFLNPKRSHLS